MRLADRLLALLAVTLWGGNFVAAKYSLAHFPPFFLTALRFTAVALILVPLTKRPDDATLKRIALLSLTLGVLHFSLLFGSLYEGLSILASILVSQLGTPFACLLGWLIFGDRMSATSIVALFLAFAGVVIIAATPDVTQHMAGFVMALFGGIAWAVATIVMKSIREKNIVVILGWMALLAIPQLLLLSALFETGQWHAFIHPTAPALAGLAYTVIFSTFVAYGIWYTLMQKYRVAQVAPFALLTPVTGIFISQWAFAEAVTPRMVAGGLLTLVSVILVTWVKPKVRIQPEL